MNTDIEHTGIISYTPSIHYRIICKIMNNNA